MIEDDEISTSGGDDGKADAMRCQNRTSRFVQAVKYSSFRRDTLDEKVI
ncbi:MAG: hypothetical protein WDN28_10420 [Chthoniobacter sp.]